MKRLIALLCALLMLGQAAHATELVSDTALNTNPTTSLGTGWSFAAGKIVASGVTGSRAAINVSVPKGTRIRYSVTIANRSAGSLRVVVGSPNMSSTGSNIAATDGLNGMLAIPDNFTTSLGLTTGYSSGPANTEPLGDVSSFRFWCSGNGYFGRFDPLLQSGVKGGSHGHRFIMNSGVNPNTTYRSMRRSGGTTCGNPRYPVQRSGYWTPWMLNGQGAIVMPVAEQFYYKQFSTTQTTACQSTPSSTSMGICIHLPNGLRYVAGYNMGSMTAATGPEFGAMNFGCRVNNGQPWGNVHPSTPSQNYHTLKAVVDAGCPAGSILFVSMEGPQCWDGVNVDSTNHKSHMAYPGSGTLNVTYWNVNTAPGITYPSCPTTHPYKIASFAWQSYYLTDASFAAGKWRLSSDEAMPTTVDAGSTLHMDYWEGWSPTWKADWELHCIDERRSCSESSNGIGTGFTTPSQQRFPMVGTDPNQYTYRPLPRTGESRPLESNGTFTGEVTADTGDSIYLYSPDGLVADITDWSMNTITPVNVLNGTTHH